MLSNNTLLILQAGANIVTILGIIVAVVGLLLSMRSFLNDKKKEHLEREYGTFDSLDNKYVEFMYACTNYPHLDLFSEPLASRKDATKEDLTIERALFSVLISIFERAFVMFERRAGNDIKMLQYYGWVQCMRSYCTRESFLHEWQRIGSQFDTDFQISLNKIIKEEQETKV